MYSDWIKDMSIYLLVYSCIATFLYVVLGAITIKRLIIRRRRKRLLKQGGKPEDLQHLNRKSVNNKYEIDSLPIRTTSDPQTRDYPLLYEDGLISLRPNIFINSANQPLLHQYEEMQAQKNISQQYESIIEHVATALASVYETNSSDEPIYEQFMKQLLKKIKEKHPGLYDSVKGKETSVVHSYEEIQEKKRVDLSSGRNSDDDNCYGTYFARENDKKGVVSDFSKKRSGFGSTDHLKFLKASNSEKTNDDAPYMEAKRFSAKIDCPEQLRKLCHEQHDNANGIKISAKSTFSQQEEVVDGCKGSETTFGSANSPTHEINSKSNSRRSEDFLDTVREMERVFSTMMPPEVPPKRSTGRPKITEC